MDFQLRMVQAAVEAQLFGQDSHPVSVGRYTVLGPIGSGGMGSVVRAHDPELQREVALKLLRAERMGDANTRSRLVQEARAMARLSHPNVAMVFEVGEVDGHLFVAMELIDGRDLRAWMDERARPWATVLELFTQAGQGLVAAHAKGLIHRDFKPDNVVVDDEGRARVVDFGLAREQTAAPTEPEPEPDAVEAFPSDKAADLTTTGTLLGTPAYMSPEQWKGEAVDARSDQFSFCVSLWEALFGERPFAGNDMGTLMVAVTEGNRRPEPSTVAVPGRVLRALRRGLSPDPAERWPDMSALLVALRPRRRGGWLAAAGVTVALATGAAVAAGVLGSEGSASEACRDQADRLADIWDSPTRERAAEGMRAAGLPFAEDVWRSASTRLDRYAAEWVSHAEASCASALTNTEDARARHTRQQRCLEDARTLLGQLGDDLATADEAMVTDAAHASTRLPDLGACADDRRLMAWADDADAGRDATVQQVRDALMRARHVLAMFDTRHVAEDLEITLAAALDDATEARDAAARVGHDPLHAEASLVRGRLLLKAGDKPEAEKALVAATERAEAAGDALTRVRARIYLVYVIGNDRDRSEEAITIGEQALAQLDGLGPRPLLRGRLFGNLATAVARDRSPDHPRAIELHRQAIEVLTSELGEDHPQLIYAHLNLGRALSFAKQLPQAEAELRAALQRAEQVLGQDHPSTARIWGTLGLTLKLLERLPESEQALRRSLELHERSLGPQHQLVASGLYNLATALRQAGRHAEAAEHLRRGIEIRRRVLGKNQNGLIPWLFALGDSEVSDGQYAAARDTLREALTLAETDGADALDFARVRHAMARATAPKDPVAARLMAQSARDAYADHGYAEKAGQLDAFLATLPGA